MLRKFGRLLRKLQRLRLVDSQLADLQARVRSLEGLQAPVADLQEQVRSLEGLQARVADLDGRAGVLEGLHARVADLEGQVESLRLAAVDVLSAAFESLRDQLGGVRGEVCRQRREGDLTRSKLEVPAGLFDEFQHWKAAHPLPAEPLVSVCVATYNRARLLTERCLPSVLGQTYGRLELIVVGDGCTDETEALVGRIRDPRLRFTNLRQRGPYPDDRSRRWMVAGASAGNEAIALAEGDFLTHLDDDDEYLPDRLEKLVRFATAHDFDFVWHPFWWEPEPGRWLLNEARELALTQVTTSSVLYRGWFKRLGWDLDAHLLEEPGDWNLFRRIKFLGPACGRYPEPLLRHYKEWNQAA